MISSLMTICFLYCLQSGVREYDADWMKEAFARGGIHDAISDYSAPPLAAVAAAQAGGKRLLCRGLTGIC